MKIKKGANIQGLDIRMRPALIAADRIWAKYGQELVITSGLDGEHSSGSLHYYGLAVDMRIYYFTATQLLDVTHELKEAIGNEFDVIVESTHIHVECDLLQSKCIKQDRR